MKKLSLRIKRIEGEIIPPSDKSITHRAIIVGALARQGFKIKRALVSGDTLATIDCLRRLGKEITVKGQDILVSPGPLREPSDFLDCRNSGTTARLLAGLLAAHPFYSVLDGDNSLRQRPMKRIVEPLSLMGARIFGRQNDSLLPLSLKGGGLRGIDYELPVASSQVKSALILAGLLAEGETVIRERIKTRDHLERMLRYLGIDIKDENDSIKIHSGQRIEGGSIIVPGDISSAAFLIALAVIVPGSHLVVRQVNFNPTRTGFINILERMGARLTVLNLEKNFNEEIADLEVRAGELNAVDITASEVPSMVDELPLIALLATQARGLTRITGAKELRHKECDRLKALAVNFKKMGAAIEELDDGLIIEGPNRLKGAKVSSFNDHRIAMTMAVAAAIAEGEVWIDDDDCIQVSYPNFWSHITAISH
ncbi:MAG: 3-phosphoshikimate 1-carboxyvinyltransferase [Candidatus Saccharicenans sp.]